MTVIFFSSGCQPCSLTDLATLENLTLTLGRASVRHFTRSYQIE